ncbi:MAG: hypothetical protein IJS26_04970 [Alphaproteobacteria bacterium]|nr:hypothetical protein [Alphaproteobacteria bacterium]
MENKTPLILKKAIVRQFPMVEAEQLERIAREAAFAPKNRMIEIDENRRLNVEDLRFVVANGMEKAPLDERNFLYATSIENLNSETSSVEEFFRWLSETTTILKHMNDGYVTEDDAKERQSFLDFTDQREGELMVCLGLYQSCRSPQAEERAKFIRYKLQKLREMRTSIKFLTKEGSDVMSTRSEYDVAIPYYKYFKNLQKLPFGYDVPYEERQKLGIDHSADRDMASDYDFYAKLVNDILDEMAKNEEKTARIKEEKAYHQQKSDKTTEFYGR